MHKNDVKIIDLSLRVGSDKKIEMLNKWIDVNGEYFCELF